MTSPNQPTQSDILAARELVKSRQNRAHWSSIDQGDWDGFKAMDDALTELMRQHMEDQV